MNTSRMILVLLACFALQACGGGDAEDDQPPPTVAACPSELRGSFDSACAVRYTVEPSGAGAVGAIGAVQIENATDAPLLYARTLALLIDGKPYAVQMVQGVAAPRSIAHVPFQLLQPITGDVAKAGQTVVVAISSHDLAASTVVLGATMTAM